MRAVLKAYIIENLIVPIVGGKNALLGNAWIESKHLWGCDPTLAKLESQDMLRTWMLDTYGHYDMDIDSAPIKTIAKKAKVSRTNMADYEEGELPSEIELLVNTTRILEKLQEHDINVNPKKNVHRQAKAGVLRLDIDTRSRNLG